jgi:hypothetical protein
MKLKAILTTAIVGAALALPSASSAASTPTQDSVTLSGGPATASNAINDFVIYDLNATSGPSGENATGHVKMDASIRSPTFTYHLDGAVTCLAVNGNQARINFTDPNLSFFGVIRVQVVDGQPDLFDSFPELDNISASDCTPIAGPGYGQVMNGDISVVDAQPSPTTKDQCKADGWKQFGFKNQGQCIAFVNYGS